MAAIRIEIAGGIGAGKTTLARGLAAVWPEGGPRLVEEDVRGVPFFQAFYAAPHIYGFEKNVSFLLSHADQIRRAAADRSLLVCDFALFQDLAYTDIVCGREDTAAVEEVHDRLVARVGHPDLVIHLTCRPDTQRARIARRGRPEEAGLERSYLVELCAAIDRRLEMLRARADVPVLTFETDALGLDPAENASAPALDRAVLARVRAALPRAGRLAPGHAPVAAGGAGI